MDATNNLPEEMRKHINPDIFNEENDQAVNDCVDKMMIDLVDQFQQHSNEIIGKFPKLDCAEGKSFINFTMSYNLVIKLLGELISHGDQGNKEAIRDMLENDLCEMIDGPMTAEEMAAAEQAVREQIAEV